MRKVFLILMMLPIILFGQSVKVKDLPTTTTGTTGDFMIKDDAAGVSGSTKKISISNFINTYFVSYPTGTGTSNYVTKWTGAHTQGNSIIQDDGTHVGVGNNNTSYVFDVTGSARATGTIYANNTVLFGIPSSFAGGALFANASNGNLLQLKAGVSTGTLTFTLPVAYPSANNQALTSTTSGTMGWSSVPVGTGTTNYIPIWTGSATIGDSPFSYSSNNFNIPSGKYIAGANSQQLDMNFVSGGFLLTGDAGVGNTCMVYGTPSTLRLGWNYGGSGCGINLTSSGISLAGTGTLQYAMSGSGYGNGLVLTSDASGFATWQAIPAGVFVTSGTNSIVSSVGSNTAIGTYDFSVGQSNTVSGFQTVGMGLLNVVSGSGGGGAAIGRQDTSSGDYGAFATGYKCGVTGGNGFTMGFRSRATNWGAFGGGGDQSGGSHGGYANGISSFAFGKYAIANSTSQYVLGGYINAPTGTNDTNKVFVKQLNIGSIALGGSSVNNLGIDASGNVVVGSGGGGSGTVTSFSAGNLSPLFSTSVATSTTTPALSFSLSTATANKFLGGYTSGSAAAPTYRSIYAVDLPATIDSTETLTIPSALFSASSLTMTKSGHTSAGTIALATQTANTVFAGATSGGATTPVFRALVAADIPSLSSSYVPYSGATGTVDLNAKTLTNTLNVNATGTQGSEQMPALTTGNWTLGTGWQYLTTPNRIDKNANGTGTVTPTAATTIVIGQTYKVVIVVSAMSGSTATYTLGGVAGTALSSATTFTDTITASTTGNLIITPVATALRMTMTTISVIPLSSGNVVATGLVNASSGLRIGSVNIYKTPSTSYNTITMDGASSKVNFVLNSNVSAASNAQPATLTLANGNAASVVLGTSTDNNSIGFMCNAASKFRFNTSSANTNTIFTFENNGTAGFTIGNPGRTKSSFGTPLTLNTGTASAGFAPVYFVSGTNLSTAEVGAMEFDGTSLFFTNGGVQRQSIPQVQNTRVSTQFDATTNTTLANITGLTATLVAGKTYEFEAHLHLAESAVGGVKFAIAGTATATAIVYEVRTGDNVATALNSQQTALGGTSGNVLGGTTGYCEIVGTITVNAAGTLIPQFAQNVSNGTSSVLVGSTFITRQIP